MPEAPNMGTIMAQLDTLLEGEEQIKNDLAALKKVHELLRKDLKYLWYTSENMQVRE